MVDSASCRQYRAQRGVAMTSGRSGSSDELTANLTTTAHRPFYTFTPRPVPMSRYVPMPLMPMPPMGVQQKEPSSGRNGGASTVRPASSSANAAVVLPVFKATNPSHVSHCAFCKVRRRALRGNSYFLLPGDQSPSCFSENMLLRLPCCADLRDFGLLAERVASCWGWGPARQPVQQVRTPVQARPAARDTRSPSIGSPCRPASGHQQT